MHVVLSNRHVLFVKSRSVSPSEEVPTHESHGDAYSHTNNLNGSNHNIKMVIHNQSARDTFRLISEQA